MKKGLGWVQPAAGLRQGKYRGQGSVSGVFLLHMTPYDRVYLDNILKAKVAVA